MKEFGKAACHVVNCFWVSAYFSSIFCFPATLTPNQGMLVEQSPHLHCNICVSLKGQIQCQWTSGAVVSRVPYYLSHSLMMVVSVVIFKQGILLWQIYSEVIHIVEKTKTITYKPLFTVCEFSFGGVFLLRSCLHFCLHLILWIYYISAFLLNKTKQ